MWGILLTLAGLLGSIRDDGRETSALASNDLDPPKNMRLHVKRHTAVQHSKLFLQRGVLSPPDLLCFLQSASTGMLALAPPAGAACNARLY
jgi:hypothetical protein